MQLKISKNYFILLFFFSSLIAKEISPGIEYEHHILEGPLSIHLLMIDPKCNHCTPHRALDEGLGREPVSSIAKRKNAIAAINGGFFEIGTMYDGLASGILKIDGNWYAFPSKQRGAIGWDKKGNFLFDKLLIHSQIKAQDKIFEVNAINKHRKEDDILIFFPCFHKTTLTSPPGLELIVKNNQIIDKASASSLIPQDGFVVSLGEKQVNSFWKSLEKNSLIQHNLQFITEYHSDREWQTMDHIVGGTPLLIHNGKKIEDFSSEKTRETFLTMRHARTAIGILKNGKWIFVVVDGKQPELSIGMTMSELAEYMQNLGCLYALNLDGGGSSTMVILGNVVNHPYGDEDEDDHIHTIRRVSDAILVLAND